KRAVGPARAVRRGGRLSIIIREPSPGLRLWRLWRDHPGGMDKPQRLSLGIYLLAHQGSLKRPLSYGDTLIHDRQATDCHKRKHRHRENNLNDSIPPFGVSRGHQSHTLSASKGTSTALGPLARAFNRTAK